MAAAANGDQYANLNNNDTRNDNNKLNNNFVTIVPPAAPIDHNPYEEHQE